jgi:hypothetical protein
MADMADLALLAVVRRILNMNERMNAQSAHRNDEPNRQESNSYALVHLSFTRCSYKAV